MENMFSQQYVCARQALMFFQAYANDMEISANKVARFEKDYNDSIEKLLKAQTEKDGFNLISTELLTEVIQNLESKYATHR